MKNDDRWCEMNTTNRIETYYKTYREISKIVHSSTALEEVLELAVWKAAEALNAKGSLIRLLNLESQKMEISASYGLSRAYLDKGPVMHPALITDLYRRNRGLIIDDFNNNPRVQYLEALRKEGVVMLLDLPLTFQDHVAGILRVYFTKKRRFSDDELDFASALAEQCSCAIGKARLITMQQSRYDQLALHTEKLSALGRMAAGIAHEINNPLASILLFSTNLLKKNSASGPLNEGLEIIVRETQRCKRIIQELLDFARDREPKKVSADLNKIIENALRMLENEFRLRHINIEKKLTAKPLTAMLDPNQFEQVMVNLLLNAVQAIDHDGDISILSTINPEQTHWTVEIADTGCGIADEHLSQIFEPFFSTKKDGTGLGLAVSYGIVRNHKGTIRVERRKGRQTCFTVTAPIAPTD
jgi:signal transduction histidine kinase